MLSADHLAILSHLRQDGRRQFMEISRRTGVAVSTIYDRYQNLLPVISKHACLVDFDKLGYPLRKQFLIRTRKRKRTWKFLKEHPAVNNAYRIHDHDAYFEALFSNMAAVEAFREELDALKPVFLREFDVLEELKREAFFTSLPGV